MSRVHQFVLFLFVCLLLAALAMTVIGRSHADNTAQTPPFAQDWSNTTLISANDDWSGVPGIIGFRGDGLTGGTGTDPQTILAADTSGVVDVNANQINPDTFATGGVTEFENTYNVVALAGSGTADAPYLLIHLSTLNYTNIQVAYNLRDIDSSADDAVQQVALHYRVGAAGSYTNVAAAYVADATTGPNQATLVTPVSITLPAAADNQPLVMLRIMTTNAIGNDEWVGVDDLSITGTFASDFPPAVSSHTPAANLIGQTVDVPVSVTFNEAVTITGTVPVVCSLSGLQNITPTTGDNLTYTLPHADFLPDESCVVTLAAAQVADADTDDPPNTMAADFAWAFSTGLPIINEIHADPDPANGDANGDGIVGATDDEFVEIVNRTGASLDISGWTLSDSVQVRYTFPARTIIPDNCVLLVFGGGTPTGQFGGAIVQALTAGSLGLNNDGDTVTLSDGVQPQAVVSYGPEGGDNQSLTRDPDVMGTLPLVQHSTAVGSGGTLFSPGTQIDGSPFSGCNACGNSATLIHTIQGNGAASPLEGQIHTIEGVVVGDFQTTVSINGFYVQEEDADADADPLTSEGLFVYYPAFAVDVGVGQQVRVAGTVDEYFFLTELDTVTSVEVCGGTAVATPLTITLPFSTTTFLERAEGMLVTLPQTLTVNENYFLGRYGELVLSNGRLSIPTNVVSPGLPAQTWLAANLRNFLILDDGSTQQNPDPIIHPSPGLTAATTIRSGDSVSGASGILTYSWSGTSGTDNYRLHPTSIPTYTHTNPRTAVPAPISGTLRVASFNLLNYFNGDGLGGGFPTPRGADTLAEFIRQRDKTIPAILALDADIIGLIELENDGYGPTSAIADLVNGLNNIAGAGVYTYVVPISATLGSDSIAVGLIYRPGVVTLNNVATTGTGAFAARNRQPLAATFTEVASGEVFTVVANHFKSKGSDCNDGTVNDPDNVFPDDPDTGDGQGNCNQTRVIAAAQLHTWLATDPTGSGDPDFLIIGDLNAYAREDPITALGSTGYTNLEADINPGAYSYVFGAQAGQLDYALSSPSLTGQVVGATTWHINTDEPSVLDYNEEFKSAGQLITLYSPDPYRASDHDPAIVGLQLGATADYSDLDSDYGTAWHVGSGAVRLGALWDADDGHTNGTDNTSDDGVQRGPGSGPGGQWQPGPDGGSLDITITGNGCLYAWIDWDQDGAFDDSDAPENLEYIIRGETTGSGNYSFEVPVDEFDPPPGPPTPTQSYNLRVRLYETCGSGPTGVAIEGEVEDYEIVFTPTAVTLQSFRAEPAIVPWLLLLWMVLSGGMAWGYGRRRA